MNQNDLQITTNSLDEKNKKLAQKILNANTLDETKDLTALFNLNIQKRNVLRVLKMNNLLDKVTEQIIERFEKAPNNFTNEDLLKYMQITENAIDRANKNLNQIEETPAIQLMQNNQVNINIDNSGINRESRIRITETVQKILNNLQQTPQENNVIEVIPQEAQPQNEE